MMLNTLSTALPPHLDSARFIQRTLSDVQTKYGLSYAYNNGQKLMMTVVRIRVEAKRRIDSESTLCRRRSFVLMA